MWYQLHIFLIFNIISKSHCSFHISDIINRLDSVARGIDNLSIPRIPESENRYDFIVVGSGSSGAVIANRLSENPNWRVLLLEAGNTGNKLTAIPVLAPLFQLTPYNWNYTMEPQSGACMGMIDQICAWPRGKALGGTSVINYMIYTRGNPGDFERWAENTSPLWSYEKVLPYYLKSENCNLGAGLCQGKYHSTGGYLSVEYPFKSELVDRFLKAGEQLGENIVDYNSANFMGYSRIQATLKQGRRHSIADAFLYPFVNSRPNLHIITSARVTKLLIEPVTKQVHGVRYRHHGKNYLVHSNKEVIVAGGVFNSPQLLMLSGIGPKDHLTEMGISTIMNLPVGESLYDHVAYLGLAFKINRTIERKDILLQPLEFFDWLVRGEGAYKSLAGVEALAYINTGSTHNSSYPDIELIMIGSGSLESDWGLVVAREIRLRQPIYDQVFKPLETTPTYGMIPMLLHPKSKGSLKLKSTNPYEAPLLYGGYFNRSEDVDTLVASIRYIQKLSRTESFRQLGAEIHDVPIPGCEHFQFDSDEYWKCAVRTLSGSLHHQVGTCPMGREGDKAVVDEQFRVWGVKGLRVADSSTIPVTLSAHTSAPSIMIGERAADFIKEDWK